MTEHEKVETRTFIEALAAKAPHVAYAGDAAQYVDSVIANHIEERLNKVLPDSLNRSLEERISLLLENYKRESSLAVKLRQRAEENHVYTSDL